MLERHRLALAVDERIESAPYRRHMKSETSVASMPHCLSTEAPKKMKRRPRTKPATVVTYAMILKLIVKRRELIAAQPELQERETGAAIFRVGFEQWAQDPKDRSLAFHVRAARRQLEDVIGQASARSAPSSGMPKRRRAKV